MKIISLQCYKILTIAFLFSSLLYCQTVESIYDSTYVKPAFQKRVLLTVKAGTVLLQPPGKSAIEAGWSLNASLSFHLGKNFYLKPVLTFWSLNYKSPSGNETKNLSVTGFFGEVEYMLAFDNLSFPIGLGIGSCASGGDSMFGLLLETGANYQFNNKMSFYLGCSYQPCAAIDFGGGGHSYAPGMIYTGISYRIK